MISFMRKGVFGTVSVVVLTGLPLLAQAEGFWQMRASVSPGQYSYEQSASSPGGAFDTDGDIFSLDLGSAFGIKLQDDSTLAFDVELEAISVDADVSALDFERTDLKASTAWVFDLGLNVAPFIGVRYAWQGDGYFNDDLYTEFGYLIGVGLSGMQLGDGLLLGVSVGFNDSSLDGEAADTDGSGYSAKLTLRPRSLPLGFSVKYQYFDIDLDSSGFGGFEEEYLTASATWYFAQGNL